MPVPGRIRAIIQDQFKDEAGNPVPEDVVMARLVAEHRTPMKIGIALDGVYQNAVREWLLGGGYVYNGSEWVKEEADALPVTPVLEP